MQMAIDHAAVVFQTYGPAPFAIGGVLAFAILVMIFRRIGVAAYTFPALILLTIAGLIFVPKEVIEAVTAGQGTEEARTRIAEFEAMAPARYIAAPALGLAALILLRGSYIVPVLALTVGLAYMIEAQFNPELIASLGLPAVKIPDVDYAGLKNLPLGGGAASLGDSVSGLAGSIPIGGGN